MLTITHSDLSASNQMMLRQWAGSRFEKGIARLFWGTRASEEWTKSLETDLTRNVVEVCEIDVDRFAVGEQKSDEGPLLFCDVGNNQIVCLMGEWLYDPHVVISDPCEDPERAWFRSFSLVRAPVTGIALSLVCRSDERIRRERIIRAVEIPILNQTAIISGSLDTLEGPLRTQAIKPQE